MNIDSAAYKIAVVGSKPKFSHTTAIKYDCIYFANGAAARAHLYTAVKKFGVISAYVFKIDQSPQVAACYDQITQSTLKHFLVIGRKEQIQFGGVIDGFVPQRRITMLVLKTIGLRNFVGLIAKAGSFYSLIREVAKLAILGYSSCSKPSTGLACVLIALSEVPRACRANAVANAYGIGLRSDGYEYLAGSFGRGHLAVDSLLVKELTSKGVLFVDLD